MTPNCKLNSVFFQTFGRDSVTDTSISAMGIGHFTTTTYDARLFTEKLTVDEFWRLMEARFMQGQPQY